ncbi:hypothetical protein HPB58_23195 [Priestia filamentosa]|uniref:hypothetical protein n=1 Tax=Priestia filamentosa TaxID=1402861 RepID=UPI001FB213E0|nr:hypothetical protein [Priestia filamentosa]MED3727952.1 hypothetical protein [Priestia filamentosa]UOE60177.1 hypothetical protein HPB58_23195 [Priestia filamentosa]
MLNMLLATLGILVLFFAVTAIFIVLFRSLVDSSQSKKVDNLPSSHNKEESI